jgi:Leucine-rich repeat (LRR) protein
LAGTSPARIEDPGRLVPPVNQFASLPHRLSSTLPFAYFAILIAVNDAPPTKLRWYRLTPDRLILGLLAVEVFLLASQWGGWLPLNQHKGWTVLTAVAAVGFAIFLLLLWFLASLIFRRRFQYGLRSLLLLVAAVAVACSWLTTEAQRAIRQREAVAAIVEMGGYVGYVEAPSETPISDCRARLQGFFGEDFFCKVFEARIDSETAMRDLDALSDLESLTLNGPAITDATIANLRGLDRLEDLEFYETKVTDAGLEQVGTLHRLRILKAPQKVTDSGLARLRDLSRLEVLDLSDAGISDTGLTDLLRLKRLRELNVSGTAITDAAIDYFWRLPRLVSLDVSGTKVTDVGLNYLSKFSQLTSLRLNGTMVTDDGLAYLQRLGQLEGLSLDYTDITDDGLYQLRQLPKLRLLSLKKTEITDAGLRHLQKLPNLTELNLEDTTVTDDGLDALAQMGRLKQIDLWGAADVTTAGLRRLQKALPNCEIGHSRIASESISIP